MTSMLTSILTNMRIYICFNSLIPFCSIRKKSMHTKKQPMQTAKSKFEKVTGVCF